MLVPRHVRAVSDSGSTALENQPQDLAAFRNLGAWVLLGEPGAGKTEALRAEASATGGEFTSVGAFVHGDPPAGWRGKTLYLDGLDEVRAGGGNDSTLRQVRTS